MTTPGKVIVAGAGPGNPDLITVKALMYLQCADVVVVDRLVSQDLLTHVKAGAKVIFVGKQGGSAHSVPQEDINNLLVELSAKYSLILRLKGGDVAFFSNVLDELETLWAHNIPYEIVPGITAASGASAYAGIPLTARGYAVSTRFLAYVPCQSYSDEVIREWAQTEDTLVFYMSSSPVVSLLERMQRSGLSPGKWVAAIEQATTPFQQVCAKPVDDFIDYCAGRKFASPTLIIIGKVVQLHQRFSWMQGQAASCNYFKSVFTEGLQERKPLPTA
jgi:uroporphyrin-III C-methyltransferase